MTATEAARQFYEDVLEALEHRGHPVKKIRDNAARSKCPISLAGNRDGLSIELVGNEVKLVCDKYRGHNGDLILTTLGLKGSIALDVAAAIAQVYAGVTPESAARANHCTVKEINRALAQPEARNIEPTSEWDAVDLLSLEFRERSDVLAGAIPVGLTLVSAAPKVGKTRFLTQVSVAAVRGSMFLKRTMTPTKVLTLALEDGARRYRKSLHYLVGTNWPGRSELTVRTTSARLDEGGQTKIEEHLDKHPDCGLVIIDVLARVRPRGRGTDKYQLDYDALASLQKMANFRDIAVVVVHHTNQRADVTDIFELVSGTAGLIGVVDSLMVLQRRRSDDVGILHIAGRSVEEQTIALSFTNGWWGQAPEGMPAELLSESKEVRALWLWLAENDGASTDDLAKRYGRTKDTTRKLLYRLEERELIDSLGKASPGQPVLWQVVRRGL
jgi:hypothetical protein